MRRHKRHSGLLKFPLEEFQTSTIIFPRSREMLRIVERSQRSGLRKGIDVEWLPDLLQSGDQFWMADAITEAKSRPAP